MSPLELLKLLPAHAGKTIVLAHDQLRLEVAPDCGARIVEFTDRNRHVLRPADSDARATGDVYGFSGFPLVPYSGPIFGGGFQYRETFYPLARNVRHEPTATHGEGWIRPWHVTEQERSSCALTFRHDAAPCTFPFLYEAQLIYRLASQGLTVSIKVTNTDHRTMPCGIGFHPYFPREPGTILQFHASGVWPPDAPENVKLGCGPLETGLDFSAGKDVAPLVLDRCFEGWRREALIRQPDGYEVRLSAQGALTRLQIYDPCDYPYVCVEPVSNANDGFNRLSQGVDLHGVAELEPGESLQGSFNIETSDHRVIG